MKIQPVGNKLLVLPLETADFVTDGGTVLIENELSQGKVVEVSPDVESIYKKGDTLLYPKGCGTTEFYKGKHHLWLRMDEPWGILQNEIVPEDKGDSL